jgi:tetratricopeptide (TPR) repeat protein
MENPHIKVGGGGRSKKSQIRFALLFAGIVVLALLIGGGARWLQQYQAHKKAARPDAITQKAQAAQDLALDGDFKGAHKQLEESLKNPELTAEAKSNLLFYQGLTYENEKKYALAIDLFKQADAAKPTQANAEAMGRVAELMGDKALAIDSYKKAAQRISPNDPVGEAMKELYESMIKRLGEEQ